MVKGEKKGKPIDYATVIFSKEMAYRLKMVRKTLGLTQAEFAKRLLISRPELSRIEDGKRKRPFVLLSVLQDAVGKHFKYLIDGSGFEKYEATRYTWVNRHGLIVNSATPPDPADKWDGITAHEAKTSKKGGSA